MICSSVFLINLNISHLTDDAALRGGRGAFFLAELRLVPRKQAAFLLYKRGFNRDETSGISGEKDQCVGVDVSMTKIYSHFLGFVESSQQMDAACRQHI